MTTIATHTETGYRPNYYHEVEALVSGHFQPLYSLLNLFFEDAETTLRSVEEIFRVTVDGDDLSPAALYRTAMDRVDFNQGSFSLLSLMPTESALCWLLKELAGLRYREIASATGIDNVQVKVHIAAARNSLMPLI